MLPFLGELRVTRAKPAESWLRPALKELQKTQTTPARELSRGTGRARELSRELSREQESETWALGPAELRMRLLLKQRHQGKGRAREQESETWALGPAELRMPGRSQRKPFLGELRKTWAEPAESGVRPVLTELQKTQAKPAESMMRPIRKEL